VNNLKKLKSTMISYVNLSTGDKMKLSNAQAVRKIKNRIFELEIEIENNNIEEIKNILESEINNLRDLMNFIRN